MNPLPLLLAAALAAQPATVEANSVATTAAPERSALAQYVRARVADADGRTEIASAGYAAALAAQPDDPMLALRSYRQALAAGDRARAVHAAGVLDADGKLPPDGTLLLLTEAVAAKNWKLASALVDRIDRERAFGFVGPVARAWIARGSRRGNPLALLDGTGQGAAGSPYAAEHRALLLLATGKRDDGIAAIEALNAGSAGRGVRLRVAAASSIAKRDRKAALALLTGTDAITVAARALVEAGKPLPGRIDDPAAGIAELLIRVAVDVNRDRATPLALGMARLSTFLAPDNAEAWLVTSELLAASDQTDAAIAVLDRIPMTDPFAEAARFARVSLLVRKGEQANALTEAQQVAAQPGATALEWSRVGELLVQLKRYPDAAAVFDKAIAVEPATSDSRWSLYLMKGNALQEAGDWPAARTALQESVRLGPEQPMALNHLGYSQLERREDVAGATKLIEKASALRPEDASITDSLGWAYFLRGETEKAIPMLERAAAGEPGEPDINEHLGDAYWTAGRRYEARYAWAAARVYADAEDVKRISAKIERGLTKELAAR